MAFRVTALASIVLFANPFAVRADFLVSGSGFSSLDGGVTKVPFDIQTGVGNGEKIVTGSGSSAVGGGPQQFLLQAGGSGFAAAAQGSLRASINTAADFMNVTPGSTFLPRVDATFTAQFTDTLVAESPTLPIGAPVQMLFTLALSGITNNPGPLPGFLGSPTGTVFLDVTSPNFSFFIPSIFLPPAFAPGSGVPASVNLAPTFVIDTRVGNSIPIQAILSLTSINRAGQGFGETSQTIMDFSHTFKLFIDPVTPGLNIASLSGHNYATGAPSDPVTAAPEPSTLTLAMLFFAVVIPVAMRGRRA